MLAQRVLNEDMACSGCRDPNSRFEMMVLRLVYMREEWEWVRSKERVGVVVGDERGRIRKKHTSIHQGDWSIARCLVTS